MKYKIARELIEKVKIFEEIDGDLIVFKKPYTKIIEFHMKDKTEKVMNLRDYSYVSLSNHGFLFVQNDPYDIIPVHLKNVEDFIVR